MKESAGASQLAPWPLGTPLTSPLSVSGSHDHVCIAPDSWPSQQTVPSGRSTVIAQRPPTSCASPPANGSAPRRPRSHQSACGPQADYGAAGVAVDHNRKCTPLSFWRSCIDDHFALLEATLDLITFIENAELNLLDDEFPLGAPFTMMAGSPICARIGRRDRAPRRWP